MPDETETIDTPGTKKSHISWRRFLTQRQREAQGKNNLTLWSLLYLWSKIGIQSLGGGSSTLFLIRREFIERRQWLTEEEYTRYWSLGQVSPGIILIAVVILIGRRLAGIRGMVVSLAGMLVPSALITTLFTVGFVLVENLQPIQSMIRSVVPATAGVMLTISLQFAHPPLRQSFQEGILQFTECVVVIVGSALALILFHSDVILVLLATVLLSVGVFLPLHQWLSRKQGERG
jgi:chromate transporter